MFSGLVSERRRPWMETAANWRKRRFRPRTGSGEMLAYFAQDCKENPKALYYSLYESVRLKQLLKALVVLVALYLFLDTVPTSYMWMTMPIVDTPALLLGRDAASMTFDTNFNAETDLLHLINLNDVCVEEKESVISWAYNSSTVDRSLVLTPDMDPNDLLRALSECPDVDIFLPASIRDHGYCEDGMAYVKYLHARALPAWVFDMEFQSSQGKTITYFDLCPKSALLFMNHYWYDLPARPSFPPTKKIIMMPNVEMYELTAAHYRRVDYIFAKTQDAFLRINAWYTQDGNPRNVKVIYTQHTSSDPTLLARLRAQADPAAFPIQPKNFSAFSVLHVNGRSVHKNTRAVLDCWRTRPDFPKLSIYAKDERSKRHYDTLFRSSAPTNIDYHFGEEVDPLKFGKLLAEASVILCPSAMEGFGHYINQARAAGALVATTNGYPMNEFVDDDSGVLIDAELFKPPIWNSDFWSLGQVMGRHYKVVRNWRIASGMEWVVTPGAICDAVDRMLQMTPAEREGRAKEGLQRYLTQLQYFQQTMFAFRVEVRDVVDELH
ncbi:Aste57867_10417 [Aphanomyces stellatus]|uniref:Aste57867_10417 protein n=1 Tax=Aphanomyces stellatus TaxID=120398 RepID=A0A485KQA4_9STRA|nr:hypothetical protein As57867_010377 [Aphanomyces stellatus]VFT87291.1 Aste57867_10417 [Aphanomyces stellatus]